MPHEKKGDEEAEASFETPGNLSLSSFPLIGFLLHLRAINQAVQAAMDPTT